VVPVGSIPMHSRQPAAAAFFPAQGSKVAGRSLAFSAFCHPGAVFEFLLPILVLLVPVLAVVALALFFGRRLSGSCGGVGPDGTCARCGKPATEIGNRSDSCP
jgi:hypothetical protein